MRSAATSPALLALLVGIIGTSACLFDEQPPCEIRDDPCPMGQICVGRDCVPDDRPPDAARPDALADATADAAPADARPPLDAGPRDGRPPDAAPNDAAAPDGAPPDMGPICAQETCNGLDDDCDGNTDEGVAACSPPDHCHWRHRGHQSYLFCDRPVSRAEAIDLCTRQLDLTVAVPDTCDETDWMWATGNLVPTPVVWEMNARGRAWWLGLELAIPDDGTSVFRMDRADTPPVADPTCWAPGEPDDVILGETCVDLLYNPATGDYGWNDDRCGMAPGNPINALCETPCDPTIDADRDGENQCVDCDDRDPDANHSEGGIDRCALAPEAGFPP